jgi:hypothetical protein
MAKSHKLTTIAVSPQVKEAIAKIGTAGMSYNDVLANLLKVEGAE